MIFTWFLKSSWIFEFQFYYFLEKIYSKAGYIQSFVISIMQPSESYIKRMFFS